MQSISNLATGWRVGSGLLIDWVVLRDGEIITSVERSCTARGRGREPIDMGIGQASGADGADDLGAKDRPALQDDQRGFPGPSEIKISPLSAPR